MIPDSIVNGKNGLARIGSPIQARVFFSTTTIQKSQFPEIYYLHAKCKDIITDTDSSFQRIK